MTIELRLECGDISASVQRLRVFCISCDYQQQEVILTFDDAQATLPCSDWQSLLDQARVEPSLSAWKHDRRVDDPISRPEIQRLLQPVSTTQAYQLLLAGLNIAERIGLVLNNNPGVIVSLSQRLSRWIPSTIGQGGLFFLPEEFFAADNAVLFDELVSNSKVCRYSINVNGESQWAGAYIPYATPIGFNDPVSRPATQLWDEIRNYYYAFR